MIAIVDTAGSVSAMIVGSMIINRNVRKNIFVISSVNLNVTAFDFLRMSGGVSMGLNVAVNVSVDTSDNMNVYVCVGVDVNLSMDMDVRVAVCAKKM